jgi:hypothetical protein
MSLLELALCGLLAVAALALLLRRRSRYASHVAQLAGGSRPAKPKRQLVVGTWSRAEVAAHNTPDDLWLILRDVDTRELKVGCVEGVTGLPGLTLTAAASSPPLTSPLLLLLLPPTTPTHYRCMT